MVRESEIRPSEVAVEAPAATDAGLVFIGRIHTPWTERLKAPRRGNPDGPVCRIELFEPWVAALDGVAAFERLEVLYWLHLSRRDLVRQSPANNGISHGTGTLRLRGLADSDSTLLIEQRGMEWPHRCRRTCVAAWCRR